MAQHVAKAGYRLNEWLAGVGFGRTKYYTLPKDLEPKTVNIDGLNIITESPADWLARVAKTQASQ